LVDFNTSFCESIDKLILECISLEKFLNQNHLIIVDTKLNLIYQKGYYPISIENFNTWNTKNENAFFLSKIRKTTSFVKACQYDYNKGSNLNMIAKPIQLNESTIGYLAIVSISEDILFLEFIIELLEKILNRDIAIYKAKYEINNIKDYFGSDIPKRTIEVLELMYLGKTDLEISKILNISTSTIRTHINILFNKFDIKSRTQLISLINKIKIKKLHYWLGE